MNLMDSHSLFAAISSLYLNASIMADWMVELLNLVVLWVIRVKIILSVKFAILCNSTVCGNTYCCGIFNNLFIKYRK